MTTHTEFAKWMIKDFLSLSFKDEAGYDWALLGSFIFAIIIFLFCLAAILFSSQI